MIEYFSYDFVRYAFIAGILISICAGLLGVSLVLKRYSFIGDGLSHVAFGATAIAAALNIRSELYVVLPVTVICAVPLLKAGRRAKIKGDAALAMLSVGAMALGYLIINKFGSTSNVSGDVCTTLFGSISILTLTKTDVWLCAIMSIIVVSIFVLFYNKIFGITFDENFAAATGVDTNSYNFIIAVVTAAVTVLAMKLVGALLVSALIVFPALTAMRLFDTYIKVIISSAIIAGVTTAIGIAASLIASTPIGATIVAVELIAFVLFSLFGRYVK